MRHPRVRDLYPEYLVASHGIVRASVPLMEVARQRATSIAGEDPVAAGLAAYLYEHIPEELDHDEWVLQDLELLGVDRTHVLARPPTPTIAQFVGAQYYWVAHYHPVALLGYIALLEGYPPMPGSSTSWSRQPATNAPRSARSTRTRRSTRATATSSTRRSTRCR